MGKQAYAVAVAGGTVDIATTSHIVFGANLATRGNIPKYVGGGIKAVFILVAAVVGAGFGEYALLAEYHGREYGWGEVVLRGGIPAVALRSVHAAGTAGIREQVVVAILKVVDERAYASSGDACRIYGERSYGTEYGRQMHAPPYFLMIAAGDEVAVAKATCYAGKAYMPARRPTVLDEGCKVGHKVFVDEQSDDEGTCESGDSADTAKVMP